VAVDRFERSPAPTAIGSHGRLAVAVLAGLVGVVLLLVAGTTVSTAAVAVLLLAAALRGARRAPHPFAAMTGTPQRAA
jgi:hypothetical protein